MRVAIVTPYCHEPLQILHRCHQSVLDQTIACDHVMVADGDARNPIDSWRCVHHRLPQPHRDNGNTARPIGGISAFNREYDAVAFLDADNWLREDHIERLVAVAEQTRAAVVFASRRIVLSSGEVLLVDDDDVIERRTADTSAFFVTKAAAHLMPIWGMMDPVVAPICDRVMMNAIRVQRISVAWSSAATLFYESRWPDHFAAIGLSAPSDAHQTDWAAIEAGYSPRRMQELLRFDPFSGAPPRRASLAPRCLLPVELDRP